MKIAIVIDTSASIFNVPRVFSMGTEVVEVKVPEEKGGTCAEPVNRLAKKFDKVFFFTDGEFSEKDISLAPNIEIILMR